ncbi:hypothetical protein N431DRAFT_552648 [Stipitochalara longipes BDJ]|nr:hypothetical protein N431DRAFT_552648 [Stipitochalara longipes BDJ]
MSPEEREISACAMIRSPPSTIILGRGDLREFERRRQRHQEVDVLNRDFSRFAVDAPDESTLASSQNQDTRETVAEGELQSLQVGDGLVADYQDQPVVLQTKVPQKSHRITSHPEHDEYGPHHSPMSSSITAVEVPIVIDLEDEHGYVAIGSENPTCDSQWSLTPWKHDFYYGGFVESPVNRSSDDTANMSSSLIPNDISTPQNNRLPDISRPRNRAPLPRSPLFLSQNASSSPEHRPTSGLTPRVESSMANHNTPGIMFSQPARRMRRPPPRTFRHQTNSFSFDSSERASAAYEQERVASTSTDDSTARPLSDFNLHEELRGSSLQSSRVTSGMSHHVPEPSVEDLSTVRMRDESEKAASTLGDFLFSSPQLSLPPPFSAVSRSASGVNLLPGVQYMPQNPATSPIRSNSHTPLKSGIEGRCSTPNSSPSGFEGLGEVDSSPPRTSGISPKSLIRRAAETMVGFYRNHSPLTHTSPSRPPSSASHRSQGRMASSELPPRTPSRTYQIYNDALPRSSQPQTPAHLPEARHQSRFHPSYTAPVRRIGPRVDRVDSRMRDFPSLERIQQLSTPLRRGAGRPASPIGMSQSGFTGLYGGRENSDEEQNWAEGVRFSYAETRLWGFRDARNDGASLRETPEPEDWRVGRRD